MPRACHPIDIEIRIKDGHACVFVYGRCPKCGTGSGYLEVEEGQTHLTQINESDGGTGTRILVHGCAVSTVCALETCEHTYAVHT